VGQRIAAARPQTLINHPGLPSIPI
jgi:hypothetical protein